MFVRRACRQRRDGVTGRTQSAECDAQAAPFEAATATAAASSRLTSAVNSDQVGGTRTI